MLKPAILSPSSQGINYFGPRHVRLCQWNQVVTFFRGLRTNSRKFSDYQITCMVKQIKMNRKTGDINKTEWKINKKLALALLGFLFCKLCSNSQKTWLHIYTSSSIFQVRISRKMINMTCSKHGSNPRFGLQIASIFVYTVWNYDNEWGSTIIQIKMYSLHSKL